MSEAKLEGPDLTQGVDCSRLGEGEMLLGHAEGEPAILVRRGNDLFALGAVCTHYGGPLAQGLVVGEGIRCPWHHACFDLRSGEALRAPGLNPVACWRVEQRDGKAYVRERISPPKRSLSRERHPSSIVIVGGGAAGNAAAERLRREGYAGPVTMLSDDTTLPCDRPNLSKNYLAGSAPYEYVPLRDAQFYSANGIEVRLRTRVSAINPGRQELQLEDGSSLAYGALLLATGAEPVRLQIPGADAAHVHYLRTVDDCQAIIDRASSARRAAVIGASFIGLEVAASLRQRNVSVDVIAPETCPMAKVLGPQVGNFLRSLHESHGVTFHLGTTASAIEQGAVILQNSERVEADFIVAGIGVRPRTALAEQAGIAVDHGVMVDEHLQTSVPGIFAAGDIARWPDPYTGERVRVEHWVVAERQGETAALNLLGARERFDAVPFFWTEQYDFGLAYVGYGGPWDDAEIDGRLGLDARECTIIYRREGRKRAAAFVHRDHQGLLQELEFEQEIGRKERALA